MGQTALLPFRRNACWGFFSPEKSNGFSRERTRDLGMLTTRPLKPLIFVSYAIKCMGFTPIVFGMDHCNRTLVVLLHQHFLVPDLALPVIPSDIFTNSKNTNMSESPIMAHLSKSFTFFQVTLLCLISLQYWRLSPICHLHFSRWCKKQSHYMLGQTLRVLGGQGSQISR
jgi:hypothetical protein